MVEKHRGNLMSKNCVFYAAVDTKKWIKAAIIRAVKTMAQTAVALIPAAVSISQVDWRLVLETAALAGIVSVLTSIAGIPEVGCEETQEISEKNS